MTDSDDAYREIDERVARDITERGFHLGLVPALGEAPGWSFTVGLGTSASHPELLCFGPDIPFIGALVERLARGVVAGASLEGAERHPGVLEGLDVGVRPVASRWLDVFLGNAVWHYRGSEFRVLQCFWPDEAGRFPWSEEFAAEWRGFQPLLYEDDSERALPALLRASLESEGAL